MILGHSSPLNISSFAGATWGMFATGSNRTSLLLTSVWVLFQRDELQLETNCPFLRGGTELMSSASAVDTERQPGKEAGKLPEGTWVTESSKSQSEVFMWAGNWYMELAMKEWENMEAKLYTVSLSKKGQEVTQESHLLFSKQQLEQLDHQESYLKTWPGQNKTVQGLGNCAQNRK